jgi:hypothetical protein
MSRRFVPLADWASRLGALAAVTQYATFGRTCKHYNFPLRTECFAMGVEPWSQANVRDEIAGFMLRSRQSLCLENYIAGYAMRVYGMNCERARQWERQNVQVTPRPAIIPWDFLSESRRASSPNYLWHETSLPAEYARLAAELGLSIPAASFDGFHSQAGI